LSYPGQGSATGFRTDSGKMHWNGNFIQQVWIKFRAHNFLTGDIRFVRFGDVSESQTSPPVGQQDWPVGFAQRDVPYVDSYLRWEFAE